MSLRNFEFNKYVAPAQYTITVPAKRDIELGYVNRYFVQKRNELSVFVEISEDSYNKYGGKGGIDPILWKRGTMKWRIKGTPEQIAITNRDTLVLVSVDFPGIQTYFRDLSEYSI